MDKVYDVTIREVREKTVAVKASSKEEAERGPVNMIFSLFSMKQWNGNQKRYLKSKSEKVVPSENPSLHIPGKKR